MGVRRGPGGPERPAGDAKVIYPPSPLISGINGLGWDKSGYPLETNGLSPKFLETWGLGAIRGGRAGMAARGRFLGGGGKVLKEKDN